METIQTLKGYLESLNVGQPITHENLTLFPVTDGHSKDLAYLLLEEALATGKLRVMERGEGTVPELHLVNESEQMVFLMDGEGRTLDQKKAGFTVSTLAALAHPIAKAKAFPLSNNHLYYFSLARQAEEIQDWAQAEEIYRKAHEIKPDYKQGVVDYANFLFKIEAYDRSLELIERLRDDEEMRFQYFLVKGRAFMGKGQYQEAVDLLLQGNEIYDSDTGLLNSLGICFKSLGEYQRALDALNASLKLNPAQEEVKALIEEIEKIK